MLEIIITIAILSFIVGGCATLITILFLMGARPDTPEKRMEDAEGLREYMEENNPCTKCYFDWKDFCDSAKRKACAEKAKGQKQC